MCREKLLDLEKSCERGGKTRKTGPVIKVLCEKKRAMKERNRPLETTPCHFSYSRNRYIRSKHSTCAESKVPHSQATSYSYICSLTIIYTCKLFKVLVVDIKALTRGKKEHQNMNKTTDLFCHF